MESLTPTLTAQELERQKAQSGVLKVLEKCMDRVHFELQGQHQKGSHYPLAVFTKNTGWRSPEKHKQRMAKRYDGSRAPQKSKEGCSRGDLASWQEGCSRGDLASWQNHQWESRFWKESQSASTVWQEPWWGYPDSRWRVAASGWWV